MGADSARQAGETCEVEITPQMVEAGFAVLCNSGIGDGYLEADKCTVVEIFLAMLKESYAHSPCRSRRQDASASSLLHQCKG